jgi:transposase
MARMKYKETAGLEAKKGKLPIGKKPSKAELKRLYLKESKTIREVAEILGCSKDMVYRSLKEYGIEMRFKTRRSQLRVHELAYLRSEIDDKGYKQVAAELGVGVTTLRDYIKSHD